MIGREEIQANGHIRFYEYNVRRHEQSAVAEGRCENDGKSQLWLAE
jgi:hypothetical protein